METGGYYRIRLLAVGRSRKQPCKSRNYLKCNCARIRDAASFSVEGIWSLAHKFVISKDRCEEVLLITLPLLLVPVSQRLEEDQDQTCRKFNSMTEYC